MELEILIHVYVPLEDESRILDSLPQIIDEIQVIVKRYSPGLQIARMNSPLTVKITLRPIGTENLRP